MSGLTQQTCEACHSPDAAMVTDEEIAELMPQIPEWVCLAQDGIPMLERLYKFKGYKKALAFANAVADLAEAEGHHPAILLEWGKVKVTWWTHAINGLHKNDFICAAKTDQVFDNQA